jgi:hypothetical protein
VYFKPNTWKNFLMTSVNGSLAAASTTALTSVHPWVEYRNDVPEAIHTLVTHVI